MPVRTSTALRRALAMLLVGPFLSAGCGSAIGQGGPTTTVVRAASTVNAGGLLSSGARPVRSADSGIAGQTVGIVCGGPASEQGCPRRPVIATIDVLRMPSAQRIATVRTDDRGHFRRNLPPGSYQLKAHASGQTMWARAVTVRILPHQIRHATIFFAPRHPLPVTASG